MKHIIDATGKKLGRVASEAAVILMGKNEPTLTKNLVPTTTVHIINASKVAVDAKKLDTKNYIRYSGYPGGQTIENMAHVVARKGYEEIFTQAIYGMIPPNKLRPRIMKHLTVTE